MQADYRLDVGVKSKVTGLLALIYIHLYYPPKKHKETVWNGRNSILIVGNDERNVAQQH